MNHTHNITNWAHCSNGSNLGLESLWLPFRNYMKLEACNNQTAQMHQKYNLNTTSCKKTQNYLTTTSFRSKELSLYFRNFSIIKKKANSILFHSFSKKTYLKHEKHISSTSNLYTKKKKNYMISYFYISNYSSTINPT